LVSPRGTENSKKVGEENRVQPAVLAGIFVGKKGGENEEKG